MTKQILGTIELENGSVLTVTRKAIGRDLLKALQAQSDGAFLSTLIAQICYLNDSPITPEIAEELDSGVSLLIQDIAFESLSLIPIQVDKYPYEYQLGKSKITVAESRKVKHDNKASRLANGNTGEIPFWLMSMLIKIDGKALRYDDLLDMDGGLVQALIPLVSPKKVKFIPVTT